MLHSYTDPVLNLEIVAGVLLGIANGWVPCKELLLGDPYVLDDAIARILPVSAHQNTTHCHFEGRGQLTWLPATSYCNSWPCLSVFGLPSGQVYERV